MLIKYIVIRIKDEVKVIFEDEFINNNQFTTQNELIEALKVIYNEKDFSVELYSKLLEIKDNENIK